MALRHSYRQGPFACRDVRVCCRALDGAGANARAVEIKIVEDADDKVVTILLSGPMASGDALRVRSFINGVAASKPIVVQLAISGGFRTDAMSIGRFLYQSRIRTVVPAKARCTAPCPLVLVGGRDPTTGRPSHIKFSSAGLGFTSVHPNFQDKDYTAATSTRRRQYAARYSPNRGLSA